MGRCGQIKAVNFITVLLKKWLKGNDIEKNSTRNEVKLVVV